MFVTEAGAVLPIEGENTTRSIVDLTSTDGVYDEIEGGFVERVDGPEWFADDDFVRPVGLAYCYAIRDGRRTLGDDDQTETNGLLHGEETDTIVCIEYENTSASLELVAVVLDELVSHDSR